MSGEQDIVVEHRKELTYLLCQAAELGRPEGVDISAGGL